MNNPSPETALEPKPTETPQPVAAVLAFVLPGLGHAYLGRLKRGLLIFLGVMGLFFGGLLVTGIDAVDSGLWYERVLARFTGKAQPPRTEITDPIWFAGAMFVGPTAFAVDQVHNKWFKVHADRASGGGMIRAAEPHEIRDPNTGEPIVVRSAEDGTPLEFTDPKTGVRRISTQADRPPYVKPLGRVWEIGTLMCTIAGMLNLIAIVDSMISFRGPERKRVRVVARGGADGRGGAEGQNSGGAA